MLQNNATTQIIIFLWLQQKDMLLLNVVCDFSTYNRVVNVSNNVNFEYNYHYDLKQKGSAINLLFLIIIIFNQLGGSFNSFLLYSFSLQFRNHKPEIKKQQEDNLSV